MIYFGVDIGLKPVHCSTASLHRCVTALLRCCHERGGVAIRFVWYYVLRRGHLQGSKAEDGTSSVDNMIRLHIGKIHLRYSHRVPVPSVSLTHAFCNMLQFLKSGASFGEESSAFSCAYRVFLFTLNSWLLALASAHGVCWLCSRPCPSPLCRASSPGREASDEDEVPSHCLTSGMTQCLTTKNLITLAP